MAFETPVLFLLFNRPDTTAKVFAQIRAIQPKYLFIAADGPRAGKDGEAERCAETRRIATAIDWDCEMKTLFREQNLGCGKAVSEGITWFFEHVEAGIILEDDCLPDLSFFRFSQELLHKYKDDQEVMAISGSNLLGTWEVAHQSYFFAHGGIWGWATWRRAWSLYDFSMRNWEDAEVQLKIKKGLTTDEWYRFYYPMMESAYHGSIDTWDAQWLYAIFSNEGKSINPCVNIVQNIGFNAMATHTTSSNSVVESLPLLEMTFPLKHPVQKSVDIEFVKKAYTIFNIVDPPKQEYQSIAQKVSVKIKAVLKKTKLFFY